MSRTELHSKLRSKLMTLVLAVLLTVMGIIGSISITGEKNGTVVHESAAYLSTESMAEEAANV